MLRVSGNLNNLKPNLNSIVESEKKHRIGIIVKDTT